MSISSGPFSHRDILKTFEALLNERRVTPDEELLKIVENLMAFRHVATKIYGFLIDAAKLGFVDSGGGEEMSLPIDGNYPADA